jgi:LmbE family N-acetylglucosaminyl deacetylase
MISFDPTRARHSDSPLKILCLGAHSDDIEIGCGGTVFRFIEKQQEASFHWVVLGADQRRAQEAQNSANQILSHAGSRNVVIKNFRNGFFPYSATEIKEYFEQLKSEFSPDLILTHYRNDLHQDHRLVSELTWNTFRDHYILEYEIPKYDGDLGSPNAFVHLDNNVVQKKLDLLFNNFQSQQDKHWFDKDAFLAIMRLRGIESNSPSRYAEAFYCRKILLG